MTTLTCDHCESEIDVALDPRCVVYEPSDGSTDVICADCRQRAWERWMKSPMDAPSDRAMVATYRIKRGWRA